MRLARESVGANEYMRKRAAKSYAMYEKAPAVGRGVPVYRFYSRDTGRLSSCPNCRKMRLFRSKRLLCGGLCGLDEGKIGLLFGVGIWLARKGDFGAG